MKYEIGNPSDKCFISTDDDKVAAAVVLFLGNGQYFCVPLEGEKRYFPTFFALGGDVDTVWKETYGISFGDFIDDKANREKILECLESFEYSGERTSMNNIGAKARSLADGLKKKLEATA